MQIRSPRCGLASLASMAASLLIACAACDPAIAKGHFITFDPAGSIATYVTSINSSGSAAGYYLDSSGVMHGFMRDANGTITTFDVTGAVRTWVFTINSSDFIAGTYEDSNNALHGFVRAPDGTITTFDVPKSDGFTSPSDINNKGTVVGFYGTSLQGFIRSRRGTFTTFDLGHFGLTNGLTINEEGYVAGSLVKGHRQAIGFERSPDGTLADFKVPQCGNDIFPYAINSTNVIAGQCGGANSSSRGFIRAPDGTFTKFKVGTDTFVSSMNNSNAITGAYIAIDGTQCGFLRTGDGKVQRFNLPGAIYVSPTGINGKGVVAGYYWGADQISHGFTGKP